MGDIVPVEKVEVVKKVKENLIKEYPLSAMELVMEVKKRLPNVGQNAIWKAIKENDIKTNTDYSVFNFRNKKQEDEYKKSGIVPSNTPIIYKYKAVDFLVNVLKADL